MVSSICYPLSPSPLPLINDSTLKSSFLHGSMLSSCGPSLAKRSVSVRCYRSRPTGSFDHIPKQFREENLKDGLMDNYKNVPECLYGLTPSQIDLFMTEANPFQWQANQIDEESLSSINYINYGGMWSRNSWSGITPSAYRGGGRYGRHGRRRRPPPDLPSIILDNRIIFIGVPIYPELVELILAQFAWLEYDNPTKPIQLYIFSSGCQDLDGQIVAEDNNAYAVADMIIRVKPKVYTLNLGMAHGQAAMLLSLGEKGYRAVMPNASTNLYLPPMYRSGGNTTQQWIQSREFRASCDNFLELLSIGTRKPKEKLAKDLRYEKCFLGEAAIEYGLADRVFYSPLKRKKGVAGKLEDKPSTPW